MQTNRFTSTPQYKASQAVKLVAPTNSTDRLLPQALQATAALFRRGFHYYKVGVSAAALVEADQVQMGLFYDPTAAKS
jgi:hypothetical protein